LKGLSRAVLQVRRPSRRKREPPVKPPRRDLEEVLRPWLPLDREPEHDVAQPRAAPRPKPVDPSEPVEHPEEAESPEAAEPPKPVGPPEPVESPQPAVSPQEVPEPELQRRGRRRQERPTSRKPPPVVASEICCVVLWRGYVKSQLLAMPDVSSAHAAFASSPYFRLPNPNSPTERALEALQTLVDELEAEDWTVVSEGRRWYELRLERPLSP